MNYNESLEYIFETYMQKKQVIKGKRYQEYKNTSIIRNLIKELQIQPNRSKVIKITGSKGKGTTARTIAHMLETQSQKQVALFTSPEEIDHTDRMSINGEFITKEEFCEIASELKPILEKAKLSFTLLDYFSPYGLFLLVAMTWFKKKRADFYVIECGRGARYDDSSSIDAEIGVITSIFKEHLDYFGPDEQHVFQDKIAISESSRLLIVPHRLKEYDLPKHTKFIDDTENIVIDIPHVYKRSFHLAKEVTRTLLGCEYSFDEENFRSTSFGFLKNENRSIVYDSLIDISGIDENWVNQHRDYFFFISIPDDKDFDQFLTRVNELRLSFKLIALSGTRGYLDYDKTLESPYDSILLEYSTPQNLAFYMQHSSSEKIVFWGTQSFIRFIKAGLA